MRTHGAVLLGAAGLLLPFGAARDGTPAAAPAAQLVATRAATAPPSAAVSDAASTAQATESVSLAAATTYTETFDGAPGAPQPWNPSNWDVTVHSRDLDTFDALEPMAASHGPDCAGPPATHTISAYSDAVFLCRNHVMTSINASGYGLIYLTPDHMVDFSAGEAVVRFAMSTERTSIRDWPDLWITPYEDNLQLPLEDFYPDLAGPPRRAIHVVATDSGSGTAFKVERYDNFQPTELTPPVGTGYENWLVADAARRDIFELRIGGGRIRFGMPAFNRWWIDEPLSLGWTRGVVQLGHHSYTPTKDCTGCSPNTWHWDDVTISPARKFSIIRSDRRAADAGAATLHFAQPAPAGANLRFAGIGDGLQVSFNGGATWQNSQRQAESVPFANDHFSSYWMPIPQGVQSVVFRGQSSFYGIGPWVVRDATIWADDGGAATAPPPLAVTSTYAALNPSRLLDTRPNGMTNHGTVTELQVAGAGGVPADAKAAVLNVTSTGSLANGFVTVWPCGQPRPLASNLNYQAGRDVANAVMANIGSGGKVCLYTGAGPTHLVVDVDGYYPSSSPYTGLNPARLLETRAGLTTIDRAGEGAGRTGVGAVTELTVTGRGSVPANAAAVVLNVTATEATTSGFLTVWPCGQPRPLASSLNYSLGRDVANAVVSSIGAGGKVCIYTGASPTHVVADVNGYFPAGAKYVPLTPARLADSRRGTTTGDGLQQGFGTPGANATSQIVVAGRLGVPAGAGAVVLNVTSAGAAAAGYLTVWPCGYARPLASSLNYSAGRDVANTVVSSVGAGGAVCIYSGVAATDIVVDVVGYFPLDATAAVQVTPDTSRLAALPPVTGPVYCSLDVGEPH